MTLTVRDINNICNRIGVKFMHSLVGMKMRSNSVFPYEIMYHACDILTGKEISIPSGEWCHGIMVGDEVIVSAELYKTIKDGI